MVRFLSIIFFGLIVSLSAQSSSSFAFSPAWDPAPGSVIDLSFLNKNQPLQRLSINKEGHFESGSNRLRLVGINITDIPEKKDAALIARRLSSMGINIVRLHHLDSTWSHNSLYPDSGWKSTLVIDKINLDKLDFFLSELAAENIMVNFNFLTGRNINNNDGLTPASQAIKNWKTKHMASMYRPDLALLADNHIKAILSHVNPYRGLSYAADPLIAMAEVINENGLLHGWQTGWMDEDTDQDGILKALWNKWLKKKFANQVALDNHLNSGKNTGTLLFDLSQYGKNKLGDLSPENHAGAVVSLSTLEGGGVALKVQKTGLEGWHIQASHGGFPVQTEQLYTFSFTARSSTLTDISIYLSMAEAPWETLGFSVTASLTPEWKTFRYVIGPSRTFSNSRIVFSGLGNKPGALVEIRAATLTEGGSLFPSGVSLDKQNLDWPRKKEDPPAALKKLWLEFLYELEATYWTRMTKLIKKDCDYQGLLIGTIVGTSTHLLQDSFDIIDAHAYFNHPEFTQTEWDTNHYFVRNRSLVKDPTLAIMSELAFKRINGKPFIVSEIDQPNPNRYNSELFPVLATFALAQDWDGWFAFNFESDNGVWDTKRIVGFFETVRNPTKMAAFQAAALAFRRQDFPAMKSITLFPVDTERDLDMVQKSDWGWDLGNASNLGFEKDNVLKKRFAIVRGNGPFPKAVTGPYFPETGISFDSEKGLYTALSDKSIFCIGFFPTTEVKIGTLSLKDLSSTLNFGFIGFQALEGSIQTGKGRFLLTAVVASENANMGITPYLGQSATHQLLTTVAHFGTAPVLAESPAGSITITTTAAKARIWALDEKGNRSISVPMSKTTNGYSFVINGSYKTLWYEIILE